MWKRLKILEGLLILLPACPSEENAETKPQDVNHCFLLMNKNID